MNRIEFYMKLDNYKAKQKAKEEEKNKGEVLMHYGTIGQKWGVRKWQNADGTFNEAGKERYFGKNGSTKKNKEENKTNKRYNKKGEELAHPDDPNDELTVKRLNEIKKLYQDQKVGGLFNKKNKSSDSNSGSYEDDPFYIRRKHDIARTRLYGENELADKMQDSLDEWKNAKYGSQPGKNNTDDQKIGGYIEEATRLAIQDVRIRERMSKDTLNEISKSFDDPDAVKNAVIKNQKIANKMIDAIENGKYKKYMKLRNKINDDFEKDMIEEYANKMADKVKNKYAEYLVNNATEQWNDSYDQKLGSWNSEKNISKATKNRDSIIEALEENPNTDFGNIKIGNQSEKKYNAKGEELAHPDDPYDELTVDRLNEIKKMYMNENNNNEDTTLKDTSNNLVKASEELSKAGNTEEAKKCKDTANEINEVRENDRKLYKEMTKEEKKEYRKAENECVKTANKGNWINAFLFGPLIGSIINGVDCWATIKVGMEKCGIKKEDRKYLTAQDWRDINLAIMKTYPKKYKKELAKLEEQGLI